jgi:hypothetical protein
MPNFALILVHGPRRVAEDPWAVTGHLEVGSIEPWALWLDFRTLSEPQ